MQPEVTSVALTALFIAQGRVDPVVCGTRFEHHCSVISRSAMVLAWRGGPMSVVMSNGLQAVLLTIYGLAIA
jgi:hypothetical protein